MGDPQASVSKAIVKPHHVLWVDDPITSEAKDAFGTKEIACRIAQLVEDTHSWESSVVVGLTGAWGSGKTSVIGMARGRLEGSSTGWAVSQFTPWATNTPEALTAEFYSALASALPANVGNELMRALGGCLRVASSLTGDSIKGKLSAKALRAFGDRLVAEPSWHSSFDTAAKELRKLNIPVLIVADDIDRLQPDELAALLKVVRLLGRFPGVTFLLAYDERALFANIASNWAQLGEGADAHARQFMEKIVQYPVAMPPLLHGQMHRRLHAGLEDVLKWYERPVILDSFRLDLLEDVFESQLTTPRSIDRFLAQLSLVMSMHKAGEVDDLDVILLTFVRVQFPDLYADLPRARRRLTGAASLRAVLDSQDKAKPPNFDDLLSRAPTGQDREDARAVMSTLFPIVGGSTISAGDRINGVHRDDYFARYFVHSIPSDDVSDLEVVAALQTARSGEGASQLVTLLEDPNPGRANLALQKLIRLTTKDPRAEAQSVTVELLASVMSHYRRPADGFDGLVVGDAIASWASNILLRLPVGTTADAITEAMSKCATGITRRAILWRSLRQDSAPQSEAVREAAAAEIPHALDSFFGNLELKDGADTCWSSHLRLDYALNLLSEEDARTQVVDRASHGLAAGAFSHEDLASRCIDVNFGYSSDGRPVVPSLGSLDWTEFDLLAPGGAATIEPAVPGDVDPLDMSWPNRRRYARLQADVRRAGAREGQE